MVNIEQLLPQDIYNAAVSANGPTILNPFATMGDLSAPGAGGIYNGSGLVPTSIVATLTDTLTFSGGQVNVHGKLFSMSGGTTPAPEFAVSGNQLGLETSVLPSTFSIGAIFTSKLTDVAAGGADAQIIGSVSEATWDQTTAGQSLTNDAGGLIGLISQLTLTDRGTVNNASGFSTRINSLTANSTINTLKAYDITVSPTHLGTIGTFVGYYIPDLNGEPGFPAATNRFGFYQADAGSNYMKGKLGLNVALPTEQLHVVGSIRMVDGNEGLGKVFTSDANGVGSWQTPSGNNTIYTADDTIGSGRVATLTDTLSFGGNGTVQVTGTGILKAGVTELKTQTNIATAGYQGNTLSTYAWLQTSAGFTAINSAAGQTLDLRIGNSTKWKVSGSEFIGDSALGEKVTIYDNGAVKYGLGVQSNEFQSIIPTSAAFTWVVGTSATHTERMRLTDDGELGIGTSNPTGYRLLIKGGDVAFEGASLANEFFLDYSANVFVFGNGAADANYKIKTYGGVNLDDGLATFNKTPGVPNRNIYITTQGLTNNGTGVIVENVQAGAGDITLAQFQITGANTNNTALSLTADNATGANNALSIAAGDVSVRQATSRVLWGVTGHQANTRFAMINEGTYTTGFDVYSNKAGDNTGYSARGSGTSSVGGNQYGFKASNVTGAANNTYAFHGNISAGGSTANTANVYGHYLDWNGPGSTRTASGLQKGLYFNMRLDATTNETISGDIFGADLLLGTGSASDSIGNITGYKARFLDTASSAITKAVGIELDFASSLATTKYGIILTGDANSGFGVAAPASRITAAGDVETTGDGNGVIVADLSTGTRYRIYMDDGVLMTQEA